MKVNGEIRRLNEHVTGQVPSFRRAVFSPPRRRGQGLLAQILRFDVLYSANLTAIFSCAINYESEARLLVLSYRADASRGPGKDAG